MKKFILYWAGGLFVISYFCVLTAVSNLKVHDFQGQCAMCHVSIPDKNSAVQGLIFVDEIDILCSKCHTINKQKSHPIKIRPNRNIPLQAHLDKNGLITCTTCHDIHKEDKTLNKFELSGLLWGHVKARAFCALCHNKEALDATWRHQTAIPYAHSSGKLIQNSNGAVLDKFSTECLSCHDGTISKFPRVEVKQGVWQHEIGESHPIGIEYPRSPDFRNPESLPKEIQLFGGKVGCLSCHEIYGKENRMMVMNNDRSRLCFACHRK